MIDTEESARASLARQHFIADEQDAVPIAERPQVAAGEFAATAKLNPATRLV